jgi:hypothetical protein
MKYNKKYILIDDAGVIRPVYNKSGWYDRVNYHCAIESIFQSNLLKKLTFELDGYLITINTKDLKIDTTFVHCEDGRIVRNSMIMFKSGGYMTEFLAFFSDNPSEWFGDDDFKAVKL